MILEALSVNSRGVLESNLENKTHNGCQGQFSGVSSLSVF